MESAHFQPDDPRWIEVLGRLAHDLYHRPEYARIDATTNQSEPRAFWARDGECEFFIPYLVRHCGWLFPSSSVAETSSDVVSPYGYPGILLSEAGRKSPDFARRAMQELSDSLRAAGVCSAFFRMHPLFSEGLAELFPAGFLTASGETVGIDLTQDEKLIWKNIRDGHQWTIRKCRRLGYAARMVPLGENIDAFIEVYQETMDRVKAKDAYYFDRGYFEQLAALGPYVHCCLVEHEGETAAACVFFECEGIVQAHLGGTKTAHLSNSPFHLALYFGAEWSKARGNRYFHLGGGVGGSNDRLLHFKRGFSDRTFPFLTLRLITDEERYRELTALSAAAANVPLEDRLQGEYFPAYRTLL